MEETSKIDVEGVMAGIRQEVALRAGPEQRPVKAPELKNARTDLAYLAALGRLSALTKFARPGRWYHVDELLCFEDEEFVRVAHLVILEREPDHAEMSQYALALHLGALHKVGIISILRGSAEGRRIGARVAGLLVRRIGAKLERLPHFGRVVRRLARMRHRFFGASDIARVRVLQSLVTQSLAEVLQLYQKLHGQLKHFDAASAARIANLEQVMLAGDAMLARRMAETKDFAPQVAPSSRPAGGEELLAAEQAVATRDDSPSGQFASISLSFEDRFRGARDDIKRRVSVYLDIVRAAGAGTATAPILDVGCGRGEWLEVVSEAGLRGMGIDLNDVLARHCRQLGYDVAHGDALVYLAHQAPGSIGALTLFHIVEHLSLRALMELLEQAMRVLRPGGVLIAETPNPANLMVGAHTFYNDPSHRNPLPVETLAFLVESCGLGEIETKFLHPYPREAWLPGGSEIANRLNQLLYGPQDYAVIARKPGAGLAR